ncbi:MAG: type II secretion system minor pseudopilin GspJ [Gammaproteobacteria bacterium]|nr:type II secretion system minor pseudopilin GspJ [Gammaproteobacteria bacterium]
MSHFRYHFRRRTSGFTLLELLVALAIFGVVAAMAYGGLQSVLNTRAASDKQAAELAELQLGFTRMERDIEQIVARSVRDGLGDRQPALRGESGGETLLEFTRTGWRNPAGQARSHLQRIAYQLKEGRLVRLSWSVLDQGPSAEPQESVLLDNVTAVEVQFLDKSLAEQALWPKPDAAANNEKVTLPRAIQVSVEIKGWGRINRLFRVVGEG